MLTLHEIIFPLYLLEPIVAGSLLLGLGLKVPGRLAVELLQLLVRLVAEGGGDVAEDGVHGLRKG